MIAADEKEKLINQIIQEKKIKISQSFKNQIEFNEEKRIEEINAQFHRDEDLYLDGDLIKGGRISENKKSIRAINCKFEDLQFRGFECDDVTFVNCQFVDFDIIGGRYRNMTFIACSFTRLNIKAGAVTSSVDLTGMKLIRCDFETGCMISRSILDRSQWLDTDINDIEIIKDITNPNKCSMIGIISDDIRESSILDNDVKDIIKNIDINTLEKEVISDKQYTNENIDIQMLINTDFYNCRFTSCQFHSDKFEENGLLNYEMRTSFNNTQFDTCTFICNLKSIRFENCHFSNDKLYGMFLYCEFISSYFTACELSMETIMNHSHFINCECSGIDFEMLKTNEYRTVRGDIDILFCERVEKINDARVMQRQIEKLIKEKDDAFTERDQYIKDMDDLEIRNKNLEKEKEELFMENTKLMDNNENLKEEMEKIKLKNEALTNECQMKSEEMRELREELKENEKSKIKLEQQIISYEQQIKEMKENNNDGTSSMDDDLLKDIVNLINERTGIKLVEEKELTIEEVTHFLAKMNEDDRFSIFSRAAKAAAERMKMTMSGSNNSGD